MAQEALRDRIVLLLTSGMSVEAVEGGAAKEGRIDADAARRLVAEVRQRIAVRPDYARDERLGIVRLDDLYAKSVAAQDSGNHRVPPRGVRADTKVNILGNNLRSEGGVRK